MKRRYTFDEVYRYAQEVRDTEEDFWNAIRRHDVAAKNQYQTQLHTMREVLLRMHESLEKYGPRRPRLIARMFAAREIRKGITDIAVSRPKFTADPFPSVLNDESKNVTGKF